MPDPLPAAAQGVPQAAGSPCTRWRRSRPAAWRSSAPRVLPGRAGRRGGGAGRARRRSRAALSQPGAILFVGERLADGPGWALRGGRRWPRETGAKLAWVPRRAGDRGAVDAGCLPNLLPGGRPVTDAGGPGRAGRGVGPQDRHDLRLARPRHRRASSPPRPPGKLGALVVAGVDPADLADPALAEQALDTVDFLVSAGAAAQRGDPPGGRGASRSRRWSRRPARFLDWEGRLRTFDTVLETDRDDRRPGARRARRASWACELGCRRRRRDPPRAGRAAARPGASRPAAPAVAPGAAAAARAPGEAVLATWHQLIDLGSLLDGDEHPRRHRPAAGGPAVARRTAAALGVADGDPVTVGTERGALTLPAAITEMPDGVVWLPTNSPGSTVRRTLGVDRRAPCVTGRRPEAATMLAERRARDVDLLAQDPTLADFGQDPWWLVLIKIVGRLRLRRWP